MSGVAGHLMVTHEWSVYVLNIRHLRSLATCKCIVLAVTVIALRVFSSSVCIFMWYSQRIRDTISMSYLEQQNVQMNKLKHVLICDIRNFECLYELLKYTLKYTYIFRMPFLAHSRQCQSMPTEGRSTKYAIFRARSMRSCAHTVHFSYRGHKPKSELNRK